MKSYRGPVYQRDPRLDILASLSTRPCILLKFGIYDKSVSVQQFTCTEVATVEHKHCVHWWPVSTKGPNLVLSTASSIEAIMGNQAIIWNQAHRTDLLV